EGDEQCAALLDVLPRSAGIVEAVAARRFLAGDGGDGVDGLTLADDGHAFDDRRVELLELLELGWPRPVAEADQRTQRHHAAAFAAHVVVVQPAWVLTVGALDLGDHLVAAAVDGEAVDFALAKQA